MSLADNNVYRCLPCSGEFSIGNMAPVCPVCYDKLKAALRGLVDAADMATDLCRCGIVDNTCIGCEALNLALTVAKAALEKKETT